ncbi:MAG: glycosyltransferase family 4 protein, partial [Pseudomonadota bacterium]
DHVRQLIATGDTVDVIAAGDGWPGEDRPDLSPAARVHRLAGRSRVPGVPSVGVASDIVIVPGVPRNAPPDAADAVLFYGAGGPEVLEDGGPRAWLAAVRFWWALCGEIRRRAPAWDRAVAHWLVPSALALRAVMPRLPLRAHAHSGDVSLLERIPGGAALARMIIRGPNVPELIFASEDLRTRFARLVGRTVGKTQVARFPVRHSVVGNIALGGAAPAQYSGPRHVSRRVAPEVSREVSRAVFGVTGPAVLAVGRLVPIKGFHVLVRAMAEPALATRPTNPDAEPRPTLIILGDGPERAALAALAQRLNVPLRLPGFVPRGEVASWMRAADVYAQPSRRLENGRTEGTPVATLEALAAGLPVVATRTGGLTAAARPGDRMTLVPPDEPRSLADALARALADALAPRSESARPAPSSP